ncbi:Uncharacterised protein [uncultured archaeon]|nr:Uncharacterised protein [uncultured archaeon]
MQNLMASMHLNMPHYQHPREGFKPVPKIGMQVVCLELTMLECTMKAKVEHGSKLANSPVQMDAIAMPINGQ